MGQLEGVIWVCGVEVLLPLSGIVDHSSLYRERTMVCDERSFAHPTWQVGVLPERTEPRASQQPACAGLQRQACVIGESVGMCGLQDVQNLGRVWRLWLVLWWDGRNGHEQHIQPKLQLDSFLIQLPLYSCYLFISISFSSLTHHWSFSSQHHEVSPLFLPPFYILSLICFFFPDIPFIPSPNTYNLHVLEVWVTWFLSSNIICILYAIIICTLKLKILASHLDISSSWLILRDLLSH